jgi:hypothetical protein
MFTSLPWLEVKELDGRVTGHLYLENLNLLNLRIVMFVLLNLE